MHAPRQKQHRVEVKWPHATRVSRRLTLSRSSRHTAETTLAVESAVNRYAFMRVANDSYGAAGPVGIPSGHTSALQTAVITHREGT